MPQPFAHQKSVSILRNEWGDFAPRTKLFAPPTNVDVLPQSTKITELWSRRMVWAPALTASPDGNSEALARPNDSTMASVGLRQCWLFLFKDLELACTLRDFVHSFSATFVTSSTRHVRTPGTQARCAKSVKRKGLSLDEKMWNEPERERCPAKDDCERDRTCPVYRLHTYM